MSTVPCHLCWAEVQDRLAMKHREWHQENRLHAASCGLLQRANAQSETEMYLAPQSCDCGLVDRDDTRPA